MELEKKVAAKRSSLLVRAIVIVVLLFCGFFALSLYLWPLGASPDEVFKDVENTFATRNAATATAVVKAPEAPAVLTAQAAEVAAASATAEAERNARQEEIFQNLEGLYAIGGTNPVSGTYTGELRITHIGSYHSVERIMSGEVISGTGLLYGETFSVSWGDPDCKAIVYQIREDGQLGGAWYLISRPDEYGLEVVDPLDDGSENFIVGDTRRVFGMNTEGERYYGSVEFAVNGSVYTADWQFDGGDISATGVQKDDILSFGWGDKNCSVAAYTVNDDGSLDGVWTNIGELWLGTEIAEKIN